MRWTEDFCSRDNEIASSLETGDWTADERGVDMVQKNMRLSVDQVAELLRRRRLFLMQLKALLEERTRIQATMKVAALPSNLLISCSP